jgi:hypothetical protein
MSGFNYETADLIMMIGGQLLIVYILATIFLFGDPYKVQLALSRVANKVIAPVKAST